MSTSSWALRSWEGVIVGGAFVVGGGVLAWAPLRDGPGAAFVRDTWPAVPLVVGLAGVVIALRSWLGTRIEVDRTADTVRIWRRAWHFGPRLARTVRRSEVDRVSVSTRVRPRRNGRRPRTTYRLELVVRSGGIEDLIPLEDGSSRSLARATKASLELDAFIRSPR